MSTQTRDWLHRLIDELPEQDLPAVEQLLTERHLDDAFRRRLFEAPEDDEPLTAEDIAAIDEGLADIARGELLSHATLRQRLADAPIDDEPLTEEDVAALDEAYRELRGGRGIPDEEMWRQLGDEPVR